MNLRRKKKQKQINIKWLYLNSYASGSSDQINEQKVPTINDRPKIVFIVVGPKSGGEI